MERLSKATRNLGRARVGVALGLALGLLFFLQTDLGRASFLAAPDRAMLDLAYYWRRNEVRAPAPPVIYVRIDDVAVAEYWRRTDGRTLFAQTEDTSSGSTLAQTPPTTPRGMLGDLLETARASDNGRRAEAVMLDVDIGWSSPGDEAGEQRLLEQLRVWAADPNAPLLIIAREMAPASARRFDASYVGDGADMRQLPPAPALDAIVSGAPNILYGLVSFQFDSNGVAREFDYAACAVTPSGRAAVPSAVLALVAAYASPSAAEAKRRILAQLASANAACANYDVQALPEAPDINYHIAIGPGYDTGQGQERQSAVPIAKSWARARLCGDGRASASWLPADELLHVSAQASNAGKADFMCGALVIIGGSTSLQPDTHWSPYGRMDGAVILANAARGQIMADRLSLPPQLQRFLQLGFQILLVVITVLLVRIAYKWVGRLRWRLHRLRDKVHGAAKFFWGVGILLVHPITLNWIAPIVLFLFGAVFTVFSLQFGFWGMITFPAFAASLSESIFEWEADLEAESAADAERDLV